MGLPWGSGRARGAGYRPQVELLEGRTLLAAGALAPLFGAGGKLVWDLGNAADLATSVAVQPDGKFIVVGTNVADFVVARYNPDGSLDPTFGSGGVVVTDFDGGSDQANDVVVQADGRIVVAGYATTTGGRGVAVARYNPDGSLDASFGGSGRRVVVFTLATSQGSAVVVQPDGRIVVAGSVSVGGAPTDIVVVRIGADGGAVETGTFNFVAGDFGEAVVLQPDGQIVVGGYAEIGGKDSFALVRFNGADLSVSPGNFVTTAATPGANNQGAQVLLQPDGKIVLVGHNSVDFQLVRYNPDLSLDGTFGVGGLVTTDFGGGVDRALDAAFQPNGKLVVVGLATVGGNSNFGVVRYHATGALDATFGTTGRVTTDFNGGVDTATGVAIDASAHKAVVVGLAAKTPASTDSDWAVARYELLGPRLYATGAGEGGGADVRVFNAETGAELFRAFAYADSGFAGGVRVAVGDVTGDGYDDLVTGAGVGGGPDVRVFAFNPDTGKFALVTSGPLKPFFAYDSGFTGGVYVAVGDVNNDGFGDILTGPGQGGGPDVRVFSGRTGGLIGTPFYAYPVGFTGGVRVASGDIDGDGFDDIIAGAGPGGGPDVHVISGKDFSATNTRTVLLRRYAFDVNFAGGMNVAAGDVDGDGTAEVIVGQGSGGTTVRVFKFNGTVPGVQFGKDVAPYPVGFTGGIFVGAVDRTGDGKDDLILGAGPGGGPDVRIIDGTTLFTTLSNAQPPFFAYPVGFTGGVFVAGSRRRR